MNWAGTCCFILRRKVTFQYSLISNEVSALERDINIAVNGAFWVEVANPEHPFMGMLISHSRGTCLIVPHCSASSLRQANPPWSWQLAIHAFKRPSVLAVMALVKAAPPGIELRSAAGGYNGQRPPRPGSSLPSLTISRQQQSPTGLSLKVGTRLRECCRPG